MGRNLGSTSAMVGRICPPHLSTAVAWREKNLQAFCLLQIFLSGTRTTYIQNLKKIK